MASPELKRSSSPDVKAAAEAEKKETHAAEEALAATELAAMRTEAADREAKAKVLVAIQENVAKDKAKSANAKPAIEVQPLGHKKEGELASVKVLTSGGASVDIQSVIPDAAAVEIAYGSHIGFDAATGRVTVPQTVSANDLPRLVREVARAAGKSNKDIALELRTRGKLEAGLEMMASDTDGIGYWDFDDARQEYKRLEEAHSATVRDAERALDGLMYDAAASYKKQTGRDLYEDAGGVEKFREQIRRQLLDDQSGLIYRYDKNRNRYLQGTAAKGRPSFAELGFFQRVGRLWDDTDTVRDYRLLRKISSLKSGLTAPVRWPLDTARTFGAGSAIMIGALTIKIVEVPWKIVRSGFDWIDDVLHGWQQSAGEKVWGKGYKPALKPMAKRREEEEAELAKAIDKKIAK